MKAVEIATDTVPFRDGTIEFDLKPLAEDIPGIRFRADRDGNAEEFYLRTGPDCRASNDCIQYAPVIHGFMLWNIYPEYQTAAPVLDGWNHVKLVVSGRRMRVSINGTPALAVGRLESDTSRGGLGLRGPAVFANLTVNPDATEDLAKEPVPDPAETDRTIVRHWQIAPLAPLRYGKDPAYAEMPDAGAPWEAVPADSSGFLNLNRRFRASDAPPSLLWLRTEIRAEEDRPRRVELGWVGEVWVFVNGQPIPRGKNFYYPESERRNPDGRLSFENGSFAIPLRRGANEVALALYTSVHDDARAQTRYRWGVKMRVWGVRPQAALAEQRR